MKIYFAYICIQGYLSFNFNIDDTNLFTVLEDFTYVYSKAMKKLFYLTFQQ